MVDLAGARVLAVLTRAPSSGGKSRLFASLGVPADSRLLEALLLDTIESAAAPGVRVVVAVTPPTACDEVRATLRSHSTALTRGQTPTLTPVPIDALVIPQVDGDLGERMRATMAALFVGGAAAVALIGSDLPHIRSSSIVTAFDTLTHDRDALILGPAADGGYYLVASTRVPDVFTQIDWGTSRVLAQTEDAARARGLRVHLLPVLTDVDTSEDLRTVAAEGRAPRTAAWIREVLQ
jgi:rSAM/selenodomain-associated transferase 1